MKNILMVCLGNICRSPLAEGILSSKTNREEVFVDSAGTGGWHAGEQPDERSIAVAAKHHIDISKQRARKFSPKDFQKFDVIYAMDTSNYEDICALATSDEDKNKVKLILSEIGKKASVPDPYYGGTDGFEKVYQMLDEACTVVAEKIKNNQL